jgi:hypothetical protein
MKYYSAIGGRARCGDIVALGAEPVVSSRSILDRPSVRGAREGIAATELAVLLPFLTFIFVIAINFSRVFYYFLTIENCALSGAEYPIYVTCNVAWPTVAYRTNIPDNAAGSQVRVTVGYQWIPEVYFWLRGLGSITYGPYNLTSRSSIPITN